MSKKVFIVDVEEETVADVKYRIYGQSTEDVEKEMLDTTNPYIHVVQRDYTQTRRTIRSITEVPPREYDLPDPNICEYCEAHVESGQPDVVEAWETRQRNEVSDYEKFAIRAHLSCLEAQCEQSCSEYCDQCVLDPYRHAGAVW